jgi:Putative esterase
MRLRISAILLVPLLLPAFVRAQTSGTGAATVATSPGAFDAQTREPAPASPSKLRFDVSFVPQIHDGPITGRAFVMVTRSVDKVPEPRLQIARTGVPFFGRDVERLQPEKVVSIDGSDLGTPLDSINDLPAGDYFVQAVVTVYSEFRRADGHVLWMHDDQWEGQRWNRAPGTLYSAVEKVHIDPRVGGVIKLVATRSVAPVEVPPDTRYVKRIKLQSPMLTKFWGRPIYLGAVVLLPRDYDRETISYPVNYGQGHFSLAPPYGFDETNDFSKAWLSDGFPRMIAVTFQHPTPYFDDSYAVNSVNNGPYGDAIMQELIPEIEKRFRVMREPYARILSGGSTGGWEAAALQMFHPDFFGGAWAYCPDSVTFMDVEGVNIYEDENAFYKVYDWRKVPTANSRMVNGQLVMTSQQRNYFELVNGTHGRSGEQIDIWSAVFGPIGKDGYFEPLFDKRTGVVNKQVAAYWREHYDLLYYLQKNWSTVGPKLVDKLFFFTGDVDTYYLNNSTKELEKWMKTTTNPHYEGFFMYGNNKPHCWSGPVSPAERLKEIAQFIQRKRPEGATTSWWAY